MAKSRQSEGANRGVTTTSAWAAWRADEVDLLASQQVDLRRIRDATHLDSRSRFGSREPIDDVSRARGR
jgi:hypothetical protein